MTIIKGLITATYTPFDSEGELNLDVIPDYTDSLIAANMEGLYVCGSTGEGVNLSLEERKQVAQAFVRAAYGRVPVLVQVGANALVDCRELAAHAKSVGADAISANAPSYFKIENAESLVDWTATIAAAAPDIPFYYYHIPGLTGVSVDLRKYVDMARRRIPCFGGIKYTEIKLYEFQDLLLYGNGDYEMFWGCDEMFLAALGVGARGGVGSTYAFLPNTFRRIVKYWQGGRHEEAAFWQNRVWQYVRVMLRHGHLHASQKYLLNRLGFAFGQCRLPIAPLTEEASSKIEKDLEQIGYFEWERPNVFAEIKT